MIASGLKSKSFKETLDTSAMRGRLQQVGSGELSRAAARGPRDRSPGRRWVPPRLVNPERNGLAVSKLAYAYLRAAPT